MVNPSARKAPARVAFLLSGSGSTLLNLLERIDADEVPAEIVVVVSDREDVGGLEHARKRGIPVAVVSRKAYRGRDVYSHAFEEALRPYAPDLIVNGGFLTIYDIPPDLVGRALNVHPSLLPAFGGKGCYGNRVHKMVLEKQVRFTGCTVHFATNEVDAGPIIDQAIVEVEADDTVQTLAARVQAAERALYPSVIRQVILGEVRMEDMRTIRS